MTNAVSVFVLTLSIAVSGLSRAADDPEAVVRAFMRAAYSHDSEQFNALAFPPAVAGVLLSTDKVTEERRKQIETAAKVFQLIRLQPFRRQGVVVASGSNGAYPDGTSTRYMAAFEGDQTVVSVIKKEGRWLVDVRWWLKVREMSLRGDQDRPDEEELVIKKFLLNLLRLNRSAVSNSLVPGSDLDIVFEGAPRAPEPSDVLPSLAIEMPVVEADADEVYPLLSGKMAKKSAAGDETVMVGLFGQFEIVFQLRRVKGEWRIAPEPYYRILNQ